ncbi:class I SAM-dependent methyltransferase [Magnetofaba australis]|uniref:Class I SAM-dependent methyltransferase n=1 Tax=Magnetofaba australis IT-1 TaxID=1434232 RepID=A0A1Y2JZ62_9PROT|nr:class I SAM-dependent methyltransferase [Magnetofaba australis]OSM00159.1 hypothetical protein MAIT1_00598 [Magnetofaba australis IT-1]
MNPLSRLTDLAAAAWYKARLRSMGYDARAVALQEHAKFTRLELDPDAALTQLNPILERRFGHPHRSDHDSIHWLLFAAVIAAHSPKRILEIGTHLGEFTAILAELAPQAQIITLDLPEDDPVMRSIYGREDADAYADFLARQRANTSAPNITRVAVNSLFMLEKVEGPFDLIWVDGDHGYPAVAWDIAMAWRLLAPGGHLLCDDVMPNLPTDAGHGVYTSVASYETLEYLAARVGAPVSYFLKRRHPRRALAPQRQKYVSCLAKPID